MKNIEDLKAEYSRMLDAMVYQNTYEGVFGDVTWYQVSKNGSPFYAETSLEVRKHSPDGFAWGYYGSGPAQLALAILLQETCDTNISLYFYQDFKDEVISQLDKDYFKLTSKEIKEWVKKTLFSQKYSCLSLVMD